MTKHERSCSNCDKFICKIHSIQNFKCTECSNWTTLYSKLFIYLKNSSKSIKLIIIMIYLISNRKAFCKFFLDFFVK